MTTELENDIPVRHRKYRECKICWSLDKDGYNGYYREASKNYWYCRLHGKDIRKYRRNAEQS